MSDIKQTILVVEDHTDLRGLFQLALSLDGFEVREARNGYEALMMLQAHQVDLVVLDLGLPGLDGLTVQQEIEADAALRRVPIVIVTASTADLSHLHVECVLRKPVRPDELVNTVRACLRAHRHDAQT